MQSLSVIIRGAIMMSLLFATTLAATTGAKAQSALPAGHHWSYVFTKDTVHLTVSVGTWDTKAMRFIQILRTDQYKFPCREKNNQFTCDMNIKEKILESYQKAGLAGVVGDSESYAAIEAKTIGVWTGLVLDQQPTTLASHSTVGYSVQTPNNNSVIFRSFVPSDPILENRAWSGKFTPHLGKMYQMSAELRKDSHLPESKQEFTIKYDNPPKVVGLGKAGHNGAPTFELTANQLVITQVDGFQLSAFSVDPKMGSGG